MKDMVITEVKQGKKKYLDLLLLADEQENMIDRYLERGRMYVLSDGEVRAQCVVTDEGDGILEIKNIAVTPASQRRGYGKALIDYLVDTCGGSFREIRVGTGDSPLTLPFYEACGFERSHIIKDFFTDHYDHSIFECGKQLVDMIYLKKIL